MNKIYILDASGYLYSCYFAIRNMTNRKGESTNALFGFVRSLLKLIKDFQPTHLVAVFDGPHNAKKREAIYSDYKAHRSTVPQDLPYQIAWAQEFCTLLGIPFLNIPEVEADDAMGSVAVWAEKKHATAYLCTSDKDMCQIVSEQILLLNTRKDNLISGPAELEQNYGVQPSQMRDYLALIGDTSDNVPGVPGIGPKSAAGLLKEHGTLDAILHQKGHADKKLTLVQENRDQALLSRELVTLDLAVHVPHTEAFYQLKPADFTGLLNFYSTMDFHSLIKEMEGLKPATEEAKEEEVPVSYQLLEEEDKLLELVETLQKKKQICFKTETTDARPMQAELVGLGFSTTEGEAWYIPVNGRLRKEQVLQAVKPLFENPHIGFYGHNVKDDLHVLENLQIRVANIVFDTMLVSYLLNSHHRQHSLEALCTEYFGKIKMPLEQVLGKGKSAVSKQHAPLQKMSTYCCEALDYTVRLKNVLQPQLAERGMEKLFTELELPLIRVLAKMEQHGIFVDTELLKKMSLHVQSKIDRVKGKIYEMAGEEFNLNSPKQLSAILQEKLQITLPKKTATGFSTNADILEEIKDQYPIAEQILEYRTLEKLRTTYIENLPHDVNPKTDRIHCTFNQSVAATGRLSCQEPNLQNIPIRTEIGREIREAFRPQKKGWVYLAADYSQIELRLLAHFSEDPTLGEAFHAGRDIHRATAAAIFNVPLDLVTPEMRHIAKAVNFGMIYGQQAYGLSKELRVDHKTAAAFIEKYFQQYSHVKEYINQCKAATRTSGKAVTFLGRERLIPEISSKNNQLRTFAERLAVNMPLQGTAADLIKMAMLSIDREIVHRKLHGFLVLQIHDELIFEIPESEAKQFEELVRHEMQTVFKLKIPLIVDISLGKNWKEC